MELFIFNGKILKRKSVTEDTELKSNLVLWNLKPFLVLIFFSVPSKNIVHTINKKYL